jgi:hypothetical protein
VGCLTNLRELEQILRQWVADKKALDGLSDIVRQETGIPVLLAEEGRDWNTRTVS